MDLVTKRYKLKDLLPDKAKELSSSLGVEIESLDFIRKGYVSSDFTFVDGEHASIDTITTKNKDRDGDIVDPDGLDFTQFEKSSAVMWCHDYKQPPIGRSLWRKKTADGWITKTQYSMANPLGKQIYEMRKEGMPFGMSVGFIPLAVDKKKEKAFNCKNYYSKSLVLEYSCTPMPSNPDALQIAVSKGLLTLEQAKEYEIEEDDFEIEIEDEIVSKGAKMDKIACPGCGHKFGYKDDGEGYAKCPECEEKVTEEGKKFVEKKTKTDETVEMIKCYKCMKSFNYIDNEHESGDYGVCPKCQAMNTKEGKEYKAVAKKPDEKIEDNKKGEKKEFSETESEIRYNIVETEGFEKFRRFALKKDKSRVFGVYGKIAGTDKWQMQALKFPKGDGWDCDKAGEWIDTNPTIVETKPEGKNFELIPVEKKLSLDKNKSCMDMVNDIGKGIRDYFKTNEDTKNEYVDAYVQDLYPTSYPNGEVVFRTWVNQKQQLYQASYTYVNDAVSISNMKEVEEGYVSKSYNEFVAEIIEQKELEVGNEIDELENDLAFATAKTKHYVDEIERLKTIEEKYIVIKEGRMLSDKNKKLIQACINALTNLMGATEKPEEKNFELEVEEDEQVEISKETLEEIFKEFKPKKEEIDLGSVVEMAIAKAMGRATL